MRGWWSALLIFFLLGSGIAQAHELRPAYLEVNETAVGQYALLWKVPALGESRLGLYVRLPDDCKPVGEPVKIIDAGAYLERWRMHCPEGLEGREIRIDGLQSSLTDVLAKLTFADGRGQLARVMPQAPTLTVSARQSLFQVARTYFGLGVEHILSGIDHLLFVLALMLLIHDLWTLAKTVTAFTVAHSITLAGAALGYFSLPQKPVEAVIALSIAFVARELLVAVPGERRLSQAYPWIVAFIFGLLHGFGFAGALKEIGLPQTDVPLALLMFNLGVEAGQLLFVGSLLLAYRALLGIWDRSFVRAQTTAAYLIGIVSTFWLVERVASFWS